MDNKFTDTKIKRGYLNTNFKLFHLKDNLNEEIELHYHVFNKIIIFLSGKASYLIEGKLYNLKPWDILLVNNYEVHKPIIDNDKPYERIILWIDSNFLENYSSNKLTLLNCFNLASKNKINLIRPTTETINVLEKIISQIELNLKSNEPFNEILNDSLFVQFMVNLNKLSLLSTLSNEYIDIKYDKNIEKILDYINANLANDLKLDSLANEFYMNKYYLMHKFKKETGYTLHSYINQKRLILALDLIKKGLPILSVCEKCGFNDYSSFVRAFKKMYFMSPKKYKDTLIL